MSMKLYELAYLNVEKDKNSRNFGVMNKFINGKRLTISLKRVNKKKKKLFVT